jgi:hypothetical protein
VQIIHPHTEASVRKPMVAPAGFTSDQAAAWGEERGMELFLEACEGAPKADAREKKEDKKEPEKRVPKLAELWIDSIDEHIRHQKASTHQSGYRSIYRKDLGPLPGKVRADQITKEYLAKLRSRMMDRGCVRSSIELAEQILTACLHWAKERGTLPATHAIPSLQWPKAEKKKVEVYTEEELEQQIDAAEDLEERVLMLLLVDGAMRIGEGAGIQWSDINWDVGMTLQRDVCDCIFRGQPQGRGRDGPADVPPEGSPPRASGDAARREVRLPAQEGTARSHHNSSAGMDREQDPGPSRCGGPRAAPDPSLRAHPPGRGR